MTHNPPDTQDSIVVRCGKCGNAIFVAVNLPHVLTDEALKDIPQMLREGCRIEHMTVEQFRKEPFGCECGKDPITL